MSIRCRKSRLRLRESISSGTLWINASISPKRAALPSRDRKGAVARCPVLRIQHLAVNDLFATAPLRSRLGNEFGIFGARIAFQNAMTKPEDIEENDIPFIPNDMAG